MRPVAAPALAAAALAACTVPAPNSDTDASLADAPVDGPVSADAQPDGPATTDAGSDAPLADAGTDASPFACTEHTDCDSTICDPDTQMCADPTAVVYVSPTGVDSPGCGTQADPCKTFAFSLPKVTESRHFVSAAAGTYAEHITISANPIHIVGYGATVEGTAEEVIDIAPDSNVFLEGLTIKGKLNGSGVSCYFQDEDDASHVTLLRTTVSGNDFGVSAGHCTIEIRESAITDNGSSGVVSTRGSNVEIYGSTIRGNAAARGAGVLVSNNATATIVDCLIQSNARAGAQGVSDGNLTIERSTIENNDGIGVIGEDASSSVTLTQSVIRNNVGGGASLVAGILANNWIVDNSSFGLSLGNDEIFFIHNTIANNSGSTGFYSGVTCDPDVPPENPIGHIIYGNTGGEGQVDPDCKLEYSNVEGGFSGIGNIQLPPKFVDPSNGDYHLQPDSPGVDAADTTFEEVDAVDIDGDARPQGTKNDMGADEVTP